MGQNGQAKTHGTGNNCAVTASSGRCAKALVKGTGTVCCCCCCGCVLRAAQKLLAHC